jgi:hypothetical protein
MKRDLPPIRRMVAEVSWQNREFNSLLTESLLSDEAGANGQQSK